MSVDDGGIAEDTDLNRSEGGPRLTDGSIPMVKFEMGSARGAPRAGNVGLLCSMVVDLSSDGGRGAVELLAMLASDAVDDQELHKYLKGEIQ